MFVQILFQNFKNKITLLDISLDDFFEIRIAPNMFNGEIKFLTNNFFLVPNVVHRPKLINPPCNFVTTEIDDVDDGITFAKAQRICHRDDLGFRA